MMVLQRQRLGRSGVEVTEIALGCAGLGNLYTAIDDETAAATVDAAWDGGVRTFDTAPHYGLGLSERRLGAALRDRPRDEYVISTKVGRILDPLTPPYGPDPQGFVVPAAYERRFDFSADGIRRSLDESLERLGLDRIDSSCCTIRTITASRRSGRRTRRWNASGTRASSVRSGPA